MWIKAFLPLAAMLVLCNCQTVVQQVCTMDRQMTTVQPGAQVIIGGLFEIRGMGTNGSGCGKPLSDTMQVFEAARFAINVLNNLNGGSGYGGVKFGLNAYDTCVSASNALGVLEMMFPQSKSSSLFCMSNNTVIAGTIGSLSSSTAIPAAALAGQLPVSLISPGATEPQLSDKFRYPTFLRTVPSYAVFAQVLAQLLQQLQWENILVVYTDDAYGRSGYEQLLMAMYNRGLCVSQSLMLDTKGNKDSYKTALTNMGNVSTPVAVLMSPNSLTKVILQAVDEVPSLASLQWVLGDIDITNDVSSLRRVRGALVVVPRSAVVDEFRQYFTQLLASPRTNAGNPWFADWFEATYGCSLTAGNCPTPTAAQFVQSPWAVPTMKAVFAYAEAARNICTNGVCSRLTTMTPTEFNSMLFSLGFTIPTSFPVSLRGQTISFDSNGDPQTSDFTVYNYNNRLGTYAFEEIGRFELNSFTLAMRPVLYDSSRNTSLTVNLTATCASLGCENCLVPQNSVSYRYRSGDLVIASLINAHEPGRAPFTCGAGRVSQLVSLVAAEWAVQQYKTNNPSQFLQVSLGSLVADVCPDTAVAQGFITDVLSRNNRLMDSSGAVIAASNIQAFVDATSDDQAEIISPIISDYNIPEVMADVSTSMISRGGSTPYFTRAAPSDEVFYSAISNVLQGLGWKYVQVATHMSGVYREMADTFTRVAARYGICVVDVSEYFGDGMMNPYSRTVRRLLSNRDTQVVVVFADMMAVRGLLTAIGQNGSSNQLQLVAGTDDWGTNPAYIQGLETAASGVIVADLDLAANTAFSSYLQNLTLAQISVNPFLRELFEMANQCALNPTSQGMYARICTSTDKFNNVYMGKALSVIGGINAVAGKLHELIADLCGGPGYSGLCSSFRSASDLGSRLSAKLTNVTKVNGLGISDGEGTTNIMFYVYSQGWKQFAQFSSESQTLLSFTPSTLGNYQGKLARCSGVCMECEYLSTMQTSIYNTGDWLIAGSFAVSNSGPEMFQPFICGDVRTSNGPQYTMAMLYALQQVNAGKAPVSVKGVKFGSWIFDHCGNPGRADLIVSDVYAGFMDRMNVDENKVLAWLTDTNESSNETVQILDPLSVATISPSATSDSLMNYQTFFRTIQGDAAAATALILIAKAMKYNYIQVVYSANTYGRDGLKLLVNTAQSEGVCVTNQLEYTNASSIVPQLSLSETDVVVLFMTESDVDSFLTSASTMDAAKSLFFLLPKQYSEIVQRVGGQFTNPIMSLQLQRFNLSDYNAYINTSPTTNPFFAQFYMKIVQCNLPGSSTYNRTCPRPLEQVTSNSRYMEDNYVLSTIDAVYSVVDALHRTVSDYCGSDYTKPCSAFLAAANKRQSFNRNLNNVNFVDDGKRSFRYLVREGATTFDILQYSSPVTYKVGSYSGQSLDISDAAMLKYSNVASTCTAPCLGCIMTGITFSHIPGDIYLAGMFDVHLRSLSPFTCDKIKTLHGFLLLEAFHYAIEQVNAKLGQFANILPGVRLGGVGLDACESDVRGGYLISNIHSGITTLSKDGFTIMPSMIDAYIGSYYSTTSIYIARILTDLKIPQISYGSGSEELSDTRVYPFFYRTVPTDNNQVEAVLKLLDKLDIRYVQIVFEDNSNGMSAMEHFVAKATNYSICVAETVAYPDLGTVSAETSATVVAELIEKPTANTIVTFLSTQYVNSLLRSIAASDKAKNKFRFIGSDSWADNQDAIRGAESQAFGSITVRLDADDVQAFENYINSKNLANSKDNPWFQDYFQNILNCYISKTNTMGYPMACPSGQVSLINSQSYQQDSDVVYVINAVYAAAFAIHKTLVSTCGLNYNTVCQSYRTNATRHEMIRDNLANVSFTDPVGKNFMFVNRSGVASYRFNSINSEYYGYTYTTIGSYNVSTGMIMLDGDYRSTVQSDCNRPDACAECPAIRDSGVRYVFHKSTQNVAETIVAFFDIHEQGVDPFRCGDINVAGFQQLVTFFYTLEKVLSNMNYRILVIDTCSNSLRVDQDLYGLLDGTGLCNSDFRVNSTNAVSMKTIGGVVTVGEANTIAASRVLELPGVTYLSPNALTTLLDSKKHLVRTIAPVSAMMKTLVSLFNKLNWTYVDVLYENSAEGIQPFHSFASYANAARVCRGSSVIVDAYPGADIQSSLAQLKGDRGSEVVVLFGSYNFVKLVLATANSMSIADRYLWVLGVEWDLTTDALRDLVPVGVEIRLITIRRLNYTVDGFRTYMNNLTYNNIHALNSGGSIPMVWYDEFYQKVFDCRLANFTKSANVSKPVCDTNKQFSSVNLTQDMYTLNLVAATYAIVQGLSDSKMLPPVDSAMSRMNILNSILNVQKDLKALGLSLTPQDVSTVLKFDTDHRWWDSEYLIKFIRVKKSADGSLNIMQNEELVRGDLNQIDKKITEIKALLGTTSVCNEGGINPCDCTYEDIEPPQPLTSQPFTPTEPRNYYYYHSNGEQQYVWSIWAIVVAIITSVGLLTAVILFLILIFAYPVRTGTTVLGYMSIIGIIGIYAINFAFFVHAMDATCGARRFLMGVVYMIAIAPLLIKAVDNWRFSRNNSEKERYSGISSAFVLLMAAIGVVLIQCIIPVIWLILVHPTASELTPFAFARHDNWWCDPPQDYDTGLVQSFIFVMFIVLVTAVFSTLTFDSDRNNFESRWILLSCIVTAGCFLVWMIVSTSATPSVRDPAVTIGNLVNATLLLLAMPLRKCILLCQHLRDKEDLDDAQEVLNHHNGQMNVYNDGFDNPMLDLNVYDNYGGMNGKPSDY